MTIHRKNLIDVGLTQLSTPSIATWKFDSEAKIYEIHGSSAEDLAKIKNAFNQEIKNTGIKYEGNIEQDIQHNSYLLETGGVFQLISEDCAKMFQTNMDTVVSELNQAFLSQAKESNQSNSNQTQAESYRVYLSLKKIHLNIHLYGYSNDVGVHLQAGHEFRKADRFESAVKEYKKIFALGQHLEFELSKATAHRFIGIIQKHQKKDRECQQSYELGLKCIKKFQENNRKNRQYLSLGSLHSSHSEIIIKLKAVVYNRYFGALSEKSHLLCNLGNFYQASGNYLKAIEKYNQALDTINKKITTSKLSNFYCLVYNSIGNCYFSLGKYGDAISTLEKALEISLKNEKNEKTWMIYENLAMQHCKLGQYRQAIKYIDEHLKIRDIGNLDSENQMYCNLGEIFVGLPKNKHESFNSEELITLLKKISLNDDKEFNDHYKTHGLDNDLFYLLSKKSFIKAFNIISNSNDKLKIGKVHGGIGIACYELKQFEEAELRHKKHYQFAEGHQLERGKAAGNLGNVYESLEKIEDAIKFKKIFLDHCIHLNDRVREGIARHNLAINANRIGNYNQAEENFHKSVEIAFQLLIASREPQQQISLLEVLSDRYLGLQRFLIERKKYDKALLVSDMKRASILNMRKIQKSSPTLSIKQIQQLAAQVNGTFIFYSFMDKNLFRISTINQNTIVHGEEKEINLSKIDEFNKYMFDLQYGIAKAVKKKISHFNHNDRWNLYKLLDSQAELEVMNKEIEEKIDKIKQYSETDISSYQAYINSVIQEGKFIFDQADNSLSVVEEILKSSINKKNCFDMLKELIDESFDQRGDVEGLNKNLIELVDMKDPGLQALKNLIEESKYKNLSEFQILLTKEIEKYSTKVEVCKSLNSNDINLTLDSMDETIKYFGYGLDKEHLLEKGAEKFITYIKTEALGLLKTTKDFICKKQVELKEAGEKSFQILKDWYELLIPEQFKNDNKTHDLTNPHTLIFIPEGELFNIPYMALNYKDSEDKIKFLIEDYTVSLSPSIHFLADITQPLTTGVQKKPEILVISNPTGDMNQAEQERDRIKQAFEQISNRTRETRVNAEVIEKSSIQTNENFHFLEKKQATKELIVDKIESLNPTHLHFTTHGSDQGSKTDYSVFKGVLKLHVENIRDEDKWNHYLYSEDIINNMKLEQITLVFMTACCVANGRIYQEGNVGLTWAFLAAKAKTVIASLWPVGDSPVTTEIVSVFYNEHVKNQSKARALQVAIKQVLSNMRNKGSAGHDQLKDIRHWAVFCTTGAL